MTWAQEIIEIFENFLEKKGVKIENPERESDGDNTAIIYGTDYGNLEQEINDFLFGKRKTSTDNQVKEKMIQGRNFQNIECFLLENGSAYYVDKTPDDTRSVSPETACHNSLTDLLLKNGYQVFSAEWDKSDEKDLNDLLATGKKPRFKRLT